MKDRVRSPADDLVFGGRSLNTSGIFRMGRFFQDLLLRGPLFAIARYRMTHPVALDASRNWRFWTRERPAVGRFLLSNLPPPWLRRRLLARTLGMDHKEGISAHYELPDRFWELLLGRSCMFYTPADFDSPDLSLEEAEEVKAQKVMDLLGVQAGQKIVDLGCGWGGMMRHIAERTGDRENLLGVTISPGQVEYIRKKLGLNVRFHNYITAEFPARSFDRMYCIGGIEHIRPDELDATMQKWSRALRPEGRLLLEFFSSVQGPMPALAVFSQLIFPGSLLAPFERHEQAWKSAGLKVVDRQSLRYEQTLESWYSRLVTNREAAIELVGVQVYNAFLNYLGPTWELFHSDYLRTDRLLLAPTA